MKVTRLGSYALIASLAAVHLYATPMVRPTSPSDLLSAGSGQERLTGASALAHLEKLQARAKRFEAATRELEDLGFTKTDDVTVVRSVGRVRSRSLDRSSKIQPVQTFGNTGGEIVFWSWDDGNAATWEGVIYVENYVTGATATWNTQMDVTTEYFEVLWEHLAASTGPSQSDELMTSLPIRGSASDVPQIASLSPTVPAASGAISDFELVQSGPSVRRWLRCVWDRCGMRSLRCVWIGPACVVHECGWDAIECALQDMM
jgi:hypothetical protein